LLTRLLIRHLRPYAGQLGLIVALQTVQSFAALSLPSLNADIIDRGVAHRDGGYVLRVGAVMVGATFVQILASVCAFYLSARVAAALGRDLRADVFGHVQRLSVRDVNRFGASSLLNRTTTDALQIQQLVLMMLTMMVVAPITALGGVLMALRQDVLMSALALTTLLALVGAYSLILSRVGPLSAAQQRLIDRMSLTVREYISGVRVVRAFVRERREAQRFEAASTDLTDVGLRLGRMQAFQNPSVLLIIESSNIAVLWFGGHRIHDGSMQVGSLVAFLGYLAQILQAVLLATVAFQMAPRARTCAARIQDVLATESRTTLPDQPVTELRRPGLLEIELSGFRYAGAEEPVLRDVCLTARPGETLAILGATGSGKTTLLKLVPRMFDPEAGRVRVGGVDVRDLGPETLARKVALVSQTPHLFSGTIAANLRHGRPDAGDDELWQALEIAQAADFVSRLPEGLNHLLVQGGHNLSGGQRQRLAIARALVARPDIYLFDDCFSALDYATDAALRAALPRITQDATVVIVAQRVVTILGADRIAVLDEGRVTGLGTHSELMRGNETYREIVLSQLTEEEAAA
jgi:ATP-binding cassette subfamily B protein